MRLVLLEKQNKQHAYLLQEKLLFWLVGDAIRSSDNSRELYSIMLERICELLDIPAGAIAKLENENIITETSFCLLDKKPYPHIKLKISKELLNRMREDPISLDYHSEIFNEISIEKAENLKPRNITLFSFSTSYLPSGIILFFEEEKSKNSLSPVKMMIVRLIQLMVDQLEKIEMKSEISKLKEQIREGPTHGNEISELQIIDNLTENALKPSIELLKNVGVEIRTPLNGVLGFSELLRHNELSTDEQNNYINIIKSCGNSIVKIIDDVVNYAIIKSEKIKIDFKEIDLTSFMSELYDQFKTDELFQQRKNLDLRLNINVNGIRKIKTDTYILNQIFSNLIGNAIKYTETGVIEIGCNIHAVDYKKKLKKNDLLFFVKDTGIGIDTEYHKEIFKEFVKVDHEISKLYGGIGLGLAITKYLVEKLDGQIWFDSKAGEGSEFYFSLPSSVLEVGELRAKKEKEKFDLGYNWSEEKILIVEDDDMSFLFLKEILRKTQVNILHAADGWQAIKMVKSNPDIQLILMDIKLPDMDGFETTKKIKKITNVPVIAQTAYAMSDDSVKILSEGFSDYISKPINRKELLRKMNVFLGKEANIDL
jgi:signal transduction histidine kinase/CheY-like chemotaxis protein